jgi:hypothetical protein
LLSGEKYLSLNGGIGQPSYIFSEERNVNHRAIGKVGQRTDETKSTIEAKKATKCK